MVIARKLLYRSKSKSLIPNSSVDKINNDLDSFFAPLIPNGIRNERIHTTHH
jgi:hypothetical protein